MNDKLELSVSSLVSESSDNLEEKINAVINSTSRMVLATSVDGNSSAASVFFARDDNDFLFFTFNPTRKARQIRANPSVQLMIWPGDGQGIRGVRVEGNCYRISNSDEISAAREKILAITDAFKAYMDDDFLSHNNVTGYYRIKPTLITYIDFHAQPQFETREFHDNQRPPIEVALGAVWRRLKLWVQAARAPFFTATLVPVLLGATIAYNDLTASGTTAAWSWPLFMLVVAGALAAHAGTNLANDYGDHISRNDEVNLVPSPFSGGSRVIQAGLVAPWKILSASILCFAVTIVIGFALNARLSGSAFAATPLLWIGVVGCLLGVLYTLGPYRLSYQGAGEIAIAIGFGPVMVLGSHYVLSISSTGGWNWIPPLLASIPVAIFVLLIVWINQFQDVPADRQVGKRNWVVRFAETKNGSINFEQPLQWYRVFGYLGFTAILLLGIIGFFDAGLGTSFALLALAPLPLFFYVNRLGATWLEAWNLPEADHQRLPYELLKANAFTILIHISIGLLLVLAYLLRNFV